MRWKKKLQRRSAVDKKINTLQTKIMTKFLGYGTMSNSGLVAL